MKIFTYLFSGLLVLLGVISFFPVPGDAHDAGVSASEMILGGILIAYGGRCIWFAACLSARSDPAEWRY